MKILIGVEDSDFSLSAVEEVARQIWEPGTEVKIVSVIEHAYAPVQDDPGTENSYKVARASVDRAIQVLRGSKNHFEIVSEILEGSPKQVLLDEAEGWGAELIVVGSHGRRGLERFLLGSVSQAVALHATCSVQIVRTSHQR